MYVLSCCADNAPLAGLCHEGAAYILQRPFMRVDATYRRVSKAPLAALCHDSAAYFLQRPFMRVDATYRRVSTEPHWTAMPFRAALLGPRECITQ